MIDSNITEAEAITDYGDMAVMEFMNDTEIIDHMQESRKRKLIGKYLIICDSRHDNCNDVRYLQDQSICDAFRGHYWTSYIANAKSFVDLSAALIKCGNLKYNNPRVVRVLKGYVLEEVNMTLDITERVKEEAKFIIDNGATIRQTAEKFSISKSTVARDMNDVLPTINETMYKNVQFVLAKNSIIKSSRGGISTTTKRYGR